MWKIWRPRLITSLLIIGSALSAHVLGFLHFNQLIDLKLSDLKFALRGSLPVPDDIVLITIDDAALSAFPEAQLFWHRYYAKAIRAAADAGAKVLALDVAFAVSVDDERPEADVREHQCDPQRDHDCVLAEAYDYARDKMPVICAVVPALVGNPQARKVPLNMMAMSDGLAAYANLTVDDDDFVRRQKLLIQESQACTEELRSLAMRTAEVYLGEDAVCKGREVTLKGRKIPLLDALGSRDSAFPDTLLINYTGPPGTFHRVSLAKFLEAADRGDKNSLRKWVAGKAVLLGPDTEYDRHATPYYTVAGGKKRSGDDNTAADEPVRWNTAGIEIHASTLNTLLTGRHLMPAPVWAAISGLLLSAAGTVLLAQWLRPVLFGFMLPVWMGSIFMAANIVFERGFVLPTLGLFESVLIATLLTTIERYFWADRKRHLFRNAIDVFVGHNVATSLEEAGSVGLSGRQQHVTIMFSDIRGFTSFCESRSPQEVVSELNVYLAQMVKIIVSHRGAVNKFIGDGILVVFSDEDGTTPGDHAERAVRCGLEMTTAPSRFKTGIGIHTGAVVIGNVGSAEKLEYTVLGETVNVASRLEGLNKQMKTRLLFSEHTLAQLPSKFEAHPLGSVRVRGLSVPLNLYTRSEVYPATMTTSVSK